MMGARRVLLAGVLASLCLSPVVSSAQQGSPAEPVRLITWFGPGSIPLPFDDSWQPRLISVYDKNMRPVIEYFNATTKVTLSFSLFENLSDVASADGCRKDAIEPIVEQMGRAISARSDGEIEDGKGSRYAVTSYLTKLMETAKNHDYFAFAGDERVCAEMHASVVAGKPNEVAAIQAALAVFHPDLTYKAEGQDYFAMGSLLFKRAPGQAAPYLRMALESMPHGLSYLIPRRIVTDRLVMALRISGALESSRSVAESAIRVDPEYPLNYYNLACADAEAGDAGHARLHLQQAFERRANTLQGTQMPDPTQDESLLKLKNDQAFWSFVKALAGG